MYYMVGGDVPESGAIYRVAEVSIGQVVDSELVVSGFTAPGSMAQDSAGNIYVPETLPSPDGKVRKVRPDSGDVVDYIIDLDYPTGVALDTFNQVYVIENGKHRITRLVSTGDIEIFKDDEIGSPEIGVIDTDDNLYLLESEANIVSKIRPSGTREVVSPVLAGVRDAAIDASGIVHLLWIDISSGTGKVLRVANMTAVEEVVVDLINPLAIAFDSANALYIAEGAPVNRISRYAEGEAQRRIVVETAGEPQSLVFTPF